MSEDDTTSRNDDFSDARGEYARESPCLGVEAFRLCGFLDGDFGDFELPPPPALIDLLVSGRIKEDAVIEPKEGMFPRLLLSYHEGHGVTTMLLREDGDLFLCNGPEIGPPTVRVSIRPQTVELWPAALFTPPAVAVQAVEHALATGRPHPELDWVGTGDFPRGRRLLIRARSLSENLKKRPML